MAKRKGGHKKSGGHRRRNPSNPRRKKGHHRRRRNPGDTFMSRAGRLLGGAAVAVATGVAVTYVQAKWMPGNPLTLYGVPAAGFLAGVALAKKAPTFGVGMALGSASPFVLPLGSRLLAAGTPTANASRTTAAVELGAVEMGNYDYLLQRPTRFQQSVEARARAY